VTSFSENIKLFNQDALTQQTDRQDHYGNTALCAMHRAVIKGCHFLRHGVESEQITSTDILQSEGDIHVLRCSKRLPWVAVPCREMGLGTQIDCVI